MTPTHTIESIFDAFTRGDVPHIVGLVAPDVAWNQTMAVPWGGRYHGPNGVVEFFTKLGTAAETTAFVVRENIESGNDVFSFGTHESIIRATGKPAKVDWMFRWRVEHGRVTRYDAYFDSAPIVAATH
jgi:uncharacterized protein